MKKKIIFILLVLTILFIKPPFLSSKEIKQNNRELRQLLLFYSQSCHACHKVKEEVMPELEKEFYGKIDFKYLDIAEVNNYKLLLSLKEKYNCREGGVPTVFIEGKILVGYDKIKAGLRDIIIEVLEKERFLPIEKLTEIDLIKRFRSLGIFTIISAGLVDGINPCAFTVIVFFISFLAFQGYRRQQLLGIGFSFIFAVFLTYILIGLGIFRFIYALKSFYLITKILYYSIALFCFILGFFALYDLWLYKKTKSTEGMTLQLPQIIKNRIHSIIGLYYRKKDKKDIPEKQASFIKLVMSAFVVGFLVSLLEAVCTGQLYLPTITFVLKEPGLRIKALWYLILYNLMFIIPLIVVLLLALLGITSEQFSQFIKKRMVIIKLVMTLLFFMFGLIIMLGA